MARNQRSGWGTVCCQDRHWLGSEQTPIRKLLKDTENKQLYLAVNWISVMEIEKLLVEQYNTDFPERMYDDKDEMSQEENSFCSLYRKPQGLKMGITVLDCHSRMRRLKCPTTDVLLNSA